MSEAYKEDANRLLDQCGFLALQAFSRRFQRTFFKTALFDMKVDIGNGTTLEWHCLTDLRYEPVTQTDALVVWKELEAIFESQGLRVVLLKISRKNKYRTDTSEHFHSRRMHLGAELTFSVRFEPEFDLNVSRL